MEGPGVSGLGGVAVASNATAASAQTMEALAGGSSMPLSTLTGDTQVRAHHYNEVVLNYMQEGINRYIHEMLPIAKACSMKIKAKLRLVVPEYWLDNKLLNPDEKYRRNMQQALMDFGMAYVDEWFTRGVVVFRFNQTPAGDKVPVLVNGNYVFITKYTDLSNDKKGYRVWRTLKRGTGEQLTHPKVDHKLEVLHGYDADPDDSGRLLTPLAPLIKEETFANLMRHCAAEAEMIRARPEKVVEMPDTQGGKVPDAYRHGYYVTGDSSKQRAEDRYERTMDDTILALQQAERLKRYWDQQLQRDQELARTGKISKKQPDSRQAQMTTLLPGAKLANQTLPSPRSDLIQLLEAKDRLICSLYEVPYDMLVSESHRTATGASTNVTMLNDTLHTWCKRLGLIFTYLYNKIYGVSDTFFQMEVNEKSGESRLRVVEIRLPHMPTVTDEQLITAFSMGAIDFKEFRMNMRRIMGLISPSGGYQGEDDENNEDPWDQETKLSMLRKLAAGAMGKTGLAGSFILNSMPVSTMVQGTQMLIDQSVNPPATPEGGAGSKRKSGGSSSSDSKKKQKA